MSGSIMSTGRSILLLLVVLAAGVQASAQPGATGISFNIQRGRFTVAQIAPGSPGDQADIPIGAILLEVDGESVEGMTSEEMVAAVRGKAGTRVRLTLEIEGEVRVVRLRRVDPAEFASPDPDEPRPTPEPRGDRPAPRPDGHQDERPDRRPAPRVSPELRDLVGTLGDIELILGITPEEAASLPAPEWVRPGLRLTYESYVSTSRNHFQRIPDYDPEESIPSGHVSIAACDIVGVEGGAAVVVRHDYTVDPDSRQVTGVSNPYTHLGPACALQDYWVHPDILAQAEARVPRGVFRGTYELDGKVYEVVRIRVQTRESVTHWMFDVHTGMLLVARSANLGGRYNTSRNNDPQHDDWDTVSGSQMRLRSIRQIDWPGMEDAGLPGWAEPGRVMAFQGQDYAVLGGQASPVRDRATRFEFIHVGDTLAVGELRAAPSASDPDPIGEALVIGAGVGNPMSAFALPPSAFESMRRDQVLDVDPITGVEIVVLDNDGQYVTIAHRHQSFLQRRVFDREGRLAQAEDFTPQPTGGQGWLMNLRNLE